MTDGRFVGLIRSASQNDTAYFTRNQLYGTYCRRQKKPIMQGLIAGAIAALAGTFCAFSADVPMFVAVLLFLVSGIIIASTFLVPPTTLTRAEFMRLIDRWMADDKSIDRLIAAPSLGDAPPPSDEPDLYDYGVQRLLIVQRDELVDWLVLNNVHAEQAMLVLSVNGYPGYLLEHTKRVLSEQPDLMIHLLHDADVSVAQMRSQVDRLGLPLEGHEVVDLGFSAEDFRRLKRAKNIDRENRDRTLPVDVLALPFLSTGLAACFASNVTMSHLLNEYAREQAVASSWSDFG
jgi:hypothetical protein